jgi:hypothetical protein
MRVRARMHADGVAGGKQQQALLALRKKKAQVSQSCQGVWSVGFKCLFHNVPLDSEKPLQTCDSFSVRVHFNSTFQNDNEERNFVTILM